MFTGDYQIRSATLVSVRWKMTRLTMNITADAHADIINPPVSVSVPARINSLADAMR
jgi:hypothetical protein